MHRLYLNTIPFYVRGLSIHGLWYPQGILDSVLGYKETTKFLFSSLGFSVIQIVLRFSVGSHNGICSLFFEIRFIFILSSLLFSLIFQIITDTICMTSLNSCTRQLTQLYCAASLRIWHLYNCREINPDSSHLEDCWVILLKHKETNVLHLTLQSA